MPRSKLLVIIFVASFVLSGIIESIVDVDTANSVGLIHVFVVAVLCFAWCKADIAERNIAEPTGSAILCALIPIIGVPVHFFRTRKAIPALIGTAKSVLVLCAAIAGYVSALYAVQYV